MKATLNGCEFEAISYELTPRGKIVDDRAWLCTGPTHGTMSLFVPSDLLATLTDIRIALDTPAAQLRIDAPFFSADVYRVDAILTQDSMSGFVTLCLENVTMKSTVAQ